MRRLLFEGLGALAGAFAVSVLTTWKLIREVDDHIYGLGGDSTGTMATLRLWADEIGYKLTGVSHVDAWGAPFGVDLGNGVNVQSVFAFYPAYVVTELVNEVVAYNIVVLSGLTFSGAAMYLLARRLGCSPLAAGWAGLVYIVFPWHLEKAQGHPSLTHLEGFPLLMLGLLAWHARPEWRQALLVAVALGVLWTTSGYFGLIGLAALPVPLGASAYVHARRSGWGFALRRLAIPAGGALLVSATIYGLASKGAAGGLIAPARTLQELKVYGARWWEFFVPSPENPQFGNEVDDWLAAHLHGSNFSESTLYLGWLTILFAAAWLVWALVKRVELSPERRFATILLAASVLVGILFAFPPGDVPAPSQLVWEVTPQFRVPTRFIALVMTGLAPLAAFGLDEVSAAVSSRARPRVMAQAAGGAVCVVAGILSFLELTISPPSTLTDLSHSPAEYSFVRQARAGIVAEYPLASSDQAVTSEYLFWRRAHMRPIVNGAPPGSFSNAVRETLIDPATPYTDRALAALGVTTIVVRPNTYAFTGPPPSVPQDLGPGYRLRGRATSGAAVWQVIAAPAPALAVFVHDFHLAETPTAGQTMRWMGGKGTVELLTRRPGTYRVTFSVGSFARFRVLSVEGLNGSRIIAAPPFARADSIVLRLPRGRSSVTVTATPGPEQLPDGRQATVYMSNWLFEPASRRERVRALVPLASSRLSS